MTSADLKSNLLTTHQRAVSSTLTMVLDLLQDVSKAQGGARDGRLRKAVNELKRQKELSERGAPAQALRAPVAYLEAWQAAAAREGGAAAFTHAAKLVGEVIEFEPTQPAVLIELAARLREYAAKEEAEPESITDTEPAG